MTYAETLNYLYNALPMFSRMGSAAFKKDLTNIRLLCEALDNAQNSFKTIHVAGTNGKGSVSHMLASILQTAGYKTGLYTSPHLYDFRERIRINGEPVDEEFVVAFTEQIKPLAEKIQPSFFEITVAMAFAFFRKQKVDVAVVEVGLGGRLDSTNIITPVLSVITNIGWDHMNLLGNSLQEIAAEKAGIIKQNIPVVIGEARPETRPVFDDGARRKAAPLYFSEEVFQLANGRSDGHNLYADYTASDGTVTTIRCDLPGLYQLKNVRTVLTAVTVLKTCGWRVNIENVSNALAQTKKLTGLRGRWEVVQHSPTVVLDVAHNPNGIEEVLKQINRLDFRTLRFVIGTVRDKDVAAVLQALPQGAEYYFTQAQIPRAMSSDELTSQAATMGLTGSAHNHVNGAVRAALADASPNDLIVVCGSIFLIAEVDPTLFADGKIVGKRP